MRLLDLLQQFLVAGQFFARSPDKLIRAAKAVLKFTKMSAESLTVLKRREVEWLRLDLLEYLAILELNLL